MLPDNEHPESVSPTIPGGQPETPRPIDKKPLNPEIVRHREFLERNGQPRVERAITFVIDEYWNTPLWKGKNADGIHQCPKGPHDATNWAWICHVPSVGAQRWRIIPWHGWYAIRYEPIDGWEPHWCIVGIYFTMAQAREALEAY